jgi:hypothetical protein
MRKIDSTLENPIDNIFLHLAEWLSPILYKTGHTPNIITTYSFISGLISLYFLYLNRRKEFAVLFVLSYIFDCIDGHFARRYDMITEFGDFYDHLTDVLIPFGILVILGIKYYQRRSFPKLSVLILLASLIFLTLVQFGCQQKYISNDKKIQESLDKLIPLCPNKERIHISKYFGSGTLIVVIAILVGSGAL